MCKGFKRCTFKLFKNVLIARCNIQSCMQMFQVWWHMYMCQDIQDRSDAVTFFELSDPFEILPFWITYRQHVALVTKSLFSQLHHLCWKCWKYFIGTSFPLIVLSTSIYTERLLIYTLHQLRSLYFFSRSSLHDGLFGNTDWLIEKYFSAIFSHKSRPQVIFIVLSAKKRYIINICISCTRFRTWFTLM